MSFIELLMIQNHHICPVSTASAVTPLSRNSSYFREIWEIRDWSKLLFSGILGQYTNTVTPRKSRYSFQKSEFPMWTHCSSVQYTVKTRYNEFPSKPRYNKRSEMSRFLSARLNPGISRNSDMTSKNVFLSGSLHRNSTVRCSSRSAVLAFATVKSWNYLRTLYAWWCSMLGMSHCLISVYSFCTGRLKQGTIFVVLVLRSFFPFLVRKSTSASILSTNARFKRPIKAQRPDSEISCVVEVVFHMLWIILTKAILIDKVSAKQIFIYILLFIMSELDWNTSALLIIFSSFVMIHSLSFPNSWLFNRILKHLKWTLFYELFDLGFNSAFLLTPGIDRCFT